MPCRRRTFAVSAIKELSPAAVQELMQAGKKYLDVRTKAREQERARTLAPAVRGGCSHSSAHSLTPPHPGTQEEFAAGHVPKATNIVVMTMSPVSHTRKNIHGAIVLGVHAAPHTVAS